MVKITIECISWVSIQHSQRLMRTPLKILIHDPTNVTTHQTLNNALAMSGSRALDASVQHSVLCQNVARIRRWPSIRCSRDSVFGALR